MLAFLDGDVPQYFVFLSELLQDVVPGDVGATFLVELCAVGGEFGVLLELGLAGCEVSGVDLSDGLDVVACGGFVVEGGDVFVDLFERLFHFYFGPSQHNWI